MRHRRRTRDGTGCQMKISRSAFSPPLRLWGRRTTLPLGRPHGRLRWQEDIEGAAVAAPYADGSRRSDGPRQLGSGVLLSRSYGECSNLDAVRKNRGLAPLSRSKSEAQNLVYSPATALAFTVPLGTILRSESSRVQESSYALRL